MADEVAVLAGGCFWCTEAVFLDVVGVKSVESGYTGGDVANPTYKQVCGGDTGHAEAIRITFDPDQLSYDDLLDIFFATHDPTQLNRQGNDVGTQYRSAIFPQDEEQERKARAAIERANDRTWRPDRHDDRAARANGIRPRIITRIIGPARGSAIPIASRSSRPSCRSCARASRRGSKSADRDAPSAARAAQPVVDRGAEAVVGDRARRRCAAWPMHRPGGAGRTGARPLRPGRPTG